MRAHSVAPTPAAAVPRSREDVPAELTWNLNDIFPDWTAWEAGCQELDSGISKFAALRGTLAKGPAQLVAAMHASDEPDSSPTRSTTSSLSVRRGPARQRHQRETPAGAGAARAVGAGDILVQPRAAADRRSRPSRNGCSPIPPSLSIGSRSRTSTGSSSTCSTRPESSCSRWPAGSRRRRTKPTKRCRQRTSSGRPSRCPPARKSSSPTGSIARFSPPAARSRIAAPPSGTAQDIRGTTQHLRRALQRCAAAGLVRCPRPPLRDHPRWRALRQRHSHVRRGER